MTLKRIIPVIILTTLIATSALAKGAEVGKTAPAFTLEDPIGISVSLDDFKEKILNLLNGDCLSIFVWVIKNRSAIDLNTLA